MPSFDDSAWPAATEYGTTPNVADIDDNAQWIWTSDDHGDNEVFCRLSLSVTESRCNNKMIF